MEKQRNSPRSKRFSYLKKYEIQNCYFGKKKQRSSLHSKTEQHWFWVQERAKEETKRLPFQTESNLHSELNEYRTWRRKKMRVGKPSSSRVPSKKRKLMMLKQQLAARTVASRMMGVQHSKIKNRTQANEMGLSLTSIRICSSHVCAFILPPVGHETKRNGSTSARHENWTESITVIDRSPLRKITKLIAPSCHNLVPSMTHVSIWTPFEWSQRKAEPKEKVFGSAPRHYDYTFKMWRLTNVVHLLHDSALNEVFLPVVAGEFACEDEKHQMVQGVRVNGFISFTNSYRADRILEKNAAKPIIYSRRIAVEKKDTEEVKTAYNSARNDIAETCVRRQQKQMKPVRARCRGDESMQSGTLIAGEQFDVDEGRASRRHDRPGEFGRETQEGDGAFGFAFVVGRWAGTIHWPGGGWRPSGWVRGSAGRFYKAGPVVVWRRPGRKPPAAHVHPIQNIQRSQPHR